MPGWSVFLLTEPLISANSASANSRWCLLILFAGFFDTMGSSDFPCPYIPTAWPLAFAGRSSGPSDPVGGEWDLPVPASEASMRAVGLRPRRSVVVLALAHGAMLPSASLNSVGVPGLGISRFDTTPASAPVNASLRALRPVPHDSGSG